MICPFQVGDRIHELRGVPVLGSSFAEVAYKINHPAFELDPMKPDATVTEITERGFKYTYDEDVPIGRAAWGTWCEGGECFEAGFQYWHKISP